MPATPSDPYQTLGVAASASDAELRVAYRRLVQRHHPDHNHGSAESERRFEEVQEAYARVRVMRQAGGGPDGTGAGPAASSAATGAGSADTRFDERLAEMERELRAAREAREKVARAAQRAARRATGEGDTERPSDEELGYISTEDSFTKILDDLADDVSTRVAESRGGAPHPRRLSDWIDELGSRLTGEPPDRSS